MEIETIKLKESNGIMIFSIMTDFTTAMEKSVQDTYQNFSKRGYKKFLFTFHPTNHITSGGIAILISLLSQSRKRKQQISVAGLSDHFKKTFTMIGISRYTMIYDSTEEAIQKMCLLN